MASDIKNTNEDVDMAECDGEKVVTMMDVLQEQEEFEEDANAVLGASDDKECTYSKGYIKRQAIYACLTCCLEAKSDPLKRAGVCLACSLICHENHDLIELYTKRNFRCDCGNPKFNSHPCTFTPNKTELNKENDYNQNFSGLYCTCHRPYPDPDSKVEDEMIQCIVCEDWLHASHLEAQVPANDQYSEMICKSCMEKNDFLHDYSSLAVNTLSSDVDVVNVNSVEEQQSSLSNNDVKLETIDSTSITNGNKSDVEMSEDKLETNNTTDSATRETKTADTEISEEQSNENGENKEQNEIVKETQNKEENIENQIKKPEKEDIQSVSEHEATSNVEPEQLTDKSENVNTDTEPSVTSEKVESLTNESSSLEENINNEEHTKQQDETVNEDSKESDNNATGDIAKEDTEVTEKITDSEVKNTEEEYEKPKQDAEKMEEDRLLADPDDDKQKPVPVEENNLTDKDEKISTAETTSDSKSAEPEIAGQVTSEEKSPKPENEQNSEIDQSKTSDAKQMEEKEILMETITQDDNKFETTVVAINGNESVDQSDAKQMEEKEIPMETITQNDNKSETTVVAINGNESVDQSDKEADKITTESSIQSENNKESSSPEKISEKRKLEEENTDTEAKKPKLDAISCSRPKGVKKIYNGSTFWPTNFRQKLCTCQECLTMYKDLSVLFLTDLEDTVSAYESLGKAKINGKPTTQYEKGLQALSSLDRIQQINALTEYNRMRDKLLDFLKSFKDRKEIVKEEDIKAFFADMKPKCEPDGVYFCR